LIHEVPAPAKFREILGAAGENETVFVIKGAIVGNHHELSRDEGWTWRKLVPHPTQ
jgi:hypothetical protein